jgi:peptide/nickel transport system substrate-binding protein
MHDQHTSSPTERRALATVSRSRTWARALAITAALAGLPAVVAGCGGGAGHPGSGSATLHLAFSFDQGTLDPDIFYGSEGLNITNSCYEGLLRYKDNSTQIEPGLADRYHISSDGLTYTFNLRPNVTFVDGSPLTSKVLKYDFARRTAINAGPAYMLADVKRVDTPDPLTLVVHMDKPVDPFLHFLASPYGPKAISQTATTAHQQGHDWGQKWLASHCAGTGPYLLTNVINNQSYTMKAYDHYWGKKPGYPTVEFTQIPNFTTQVLELRSGQLDLLIHGVPTQQVTAFKNDSRFTVTRLPALAMLQFWINLHREPFTDIKVRRAVAMALDRQKLLETVYGDGATLFNSVDYPGTLPAKYGGVYSIPYDPQAAKEIVSKLPPAKRKIDINYQTDDSRNAQLAGLEAADLRAVGFDASTNGMVADGIYSVNKAPANRRPFILINPGGPDDASATSGPLLTWITDPKQGFGYYKPYDPEADRLLYQGMATPNHEKAMKLYGAAMDRYRDLDTFVPLGNLLITVVARKGIAGIASERQGGWLLDIAALHEG